jgi:lysophospholipase L1-like esterase
MADLKQVDITGGAIRVAGIVEMEPSDAGIVLHRLPPWVHSRHNDLTLPFLETMPSGARIEMTTDATSLELEVFLTLIQVGSEQGPAAAFDLVVDGEIVATEVSRTGALIVIDPISRGISFEAGEPTTIRFDGLPSGSKSIELWLPNAAMVRLIGLKTDGTVRPPSTSPRRWVHYGSSISHCLEATQPTGVWPAVAARLAGVDLMSFGLAGQCQLDPFMGRVIATQDADLISLKLGINIVNGDTMRERTFVPAVHGLLDAIRERHADVPIILVTPIICPVAEDHPGPTLLNPGEKVTVLDRPAEASTGALTLQRIRELEAEVVAGRRAAGDANLHLLSGLDLFGPDDAVDLPDGLHPNAGGYRRIGERFHQLAFETGPFGSG